MKQLQQPLSLESNNVQRHDAASLLKHLKRTKNAKYAFVTPSGYLLLNPATNEPYRAYNVHGVYGYTNGCDNQTSQTAIDFVILQGLAAILDQAPYVIRFSDLHLSGLLSYE